MRDTERLVCLGTPKGPDQLQNSGAPLFKIIKHLKINFAKEVKNLYTKYDKTLRKEFKEDK